MLDSDFETEDGAVRVIDFMPRRGDGPPRVMRIAQGLKGRVPRRMELSLRPDYGSIVPWVERAPDGLGNVWSPRRQASHSPAGWGSAHAPGVSSRCWAGAWQIEVTR